MNIAGIEKESIVDGTGIRLSLFISGCTNRCPGCFNPEAWDFSYGQELDEVLAGEVVEELAKSHYDGLTVLGGEPFEMQNQPDVWKLIRTVRWILPEKTVWVYTGCVYDRDLLPGGRRYGKYTDRILDAIDVLVDGPFVEGLKSAEIPFRGSTNQRVIDMKLTRKSGRVRLYPV